MKAFLSKVRRNPKIVSVDLALRAKDIGHFKTIYCQCVIFFWEQSVHFIDSFTDGQFVSLWVQSWVCTGVHVEPYASMLSAVPHHSSPYFLKQRLSMKSWYWLSLAGWSANPGESSCLCFLSTELQICVSPLRFPHEVWVIELTSSYYITSTLPTSPNWQLVFNF